MKRNNITYLILAVLGVIGFNIFLANASELSELSKLKAENLKLKAQLNSCMLAAEESKLVESFRGELNATEKDLFDWSSLSFKSSVNK